MKKAGRALLGLWVALFSLPAAGEEFILGISQGSTAAIPVMKELGIRWGRASVALNELMPELADPLLELEEVRGKAAAAEDFARAVDWTPVDAKLRAWLDNGIQPLVSVGHGWIGTYARRHGRETTPDRLGRKHYLAYMYVYTRAVVERYDGDGESDAPGIVVKLWQTENELNQAGLTAAWGWRQPDWVAGFFSAWNDWDFLTELLGVLYQAVHDADPQAQTLMNFHTDIHPAINRWLGQPDWMEAVVEWKDLMDIIGLDAYPNYYSPDPVRADVVGERVRTVRRLAPGKPVIIVEIDYPYGPAVRGFSPEKQAEFLRASYEAARLAGAAGYFKFRVVDPDADKYNQIELTAEDLAHLEKIIPLYEQGRVGHLLAWAIPRAFYIQRHFLDVLKSVEGHWGVITPAGERLPSYYVLQEISREVP